MIENVIKFSPRQSDLRTTSEMWIGDSYAQRKKKVLSYIKENLNCVPSPKMWFIREGVFTIKSGTTMEQLRGLAERIKEECVIDCFQISISRHKRQACMLFDWYDYKNKKCFYMFSTYQLRISVMIIRYLDLPTPKDLTPQWSKFFLKWEYRKDKKAFTNLLERLKYVRLNKRQYQLLKDSLTYVNNVCKGVTK